MLSGGVGRGGAARLAARGALRIGAGLVTVGCPTPAVLEHAARLDAVMCEPIDDPATLVSVMDTRNVETVCCGPGLGIARAQALLPALLNLEHNISVKAVLDADALTAYQQNPKTLFQMLHENCVITPHEGEFGRLYPDLLDPIRTAAGLSSSDAGKDNAKTQSAREAAARAGCVVLLKGPTTVIAHPDGRVTVISSQAPWLATAGSGDVLAGFITGLMARGYLPFEAAAIGAWLHVRCAQMFGPCLIAEDIPEQLPALFRSFGFDGTC